jgi:uracil-DNA glycosylase
MQKPLMVGESPSRTGDRYHRFPLSGAPARTLCRAAGWEPDGPASELGSWTWALYGWFETVNVFSRYADATPWSAVIARQRAIEIVKDSRPGTIVVLGNRVAAAFGILDSSNPFVWLEWSSAAIGHSYRIVRIPHPSGRNRLLNDPAMREAVGRTLREAVSPI